MPGPSSLTIRTFQPTDAEPLAALLRNAIQAGELDGYTATELEGLIGAFPIARNFLVGDLGGESVGLVCHEYRLLIVRPDARRRGVGRALADGLNAALTETPDGALVLFPPHGNAGAEAFLRAIGFRYDHSSWRLVLDAGNRQARSELPNPMRLDRFRYAEIDEYIDLINTAFLDHPTPLRVTREQIEHVHANDNFDPERIAVVRNETGAMVGFCTVGLDTSTAPATGSIRLLGVLPAYRGRGLGRWLLLWGIERLRSEGIEHIELSVDAQNANAMLLYRSAGFEPVEEWPQWIRDVSR